MTFSEQTEKRVISFVNKIASKCAECNRRNTGTCGNCISLWAKSIWTDIQLDRDSDQRKIDYSIATRIANIILSLTNAKRPLMSSEIDLNGTCSKQLKRWTLFHMMKTGKIVRTTDKKTGRYLYALKRR